MGILDWLVFFAFIGYVVWDGVRRRSSATNLEGYFVDHGDTGERHHRHRHHRPRP